MGTTTTQANCFTVGQQSILIPVRPKLWTLLEERIRPFTTHQVPLLGCHNPGPRDHLAYLPTLYTGCRSKLSLIALPLVRGRVEVIHERIPSRKLGTCTNNDPGNTAKGLTTMSNNIRDGIQFFRAAEAQLALPSKGAGMDQRSKSPLYKFIE